MSYINKEAIVSLKEALELSFQLNMVLEELSITLRINKRCQFTAEEFAKHIRSKNIKLEFCGLQTKNDKHYIESFFEAYEKWKNYRK